MYLLLGQQPPLPTPAFLLAITALMKHLQLIMTPSRVSPT